MGSTLIEKIIEKNTGLSKVTPGQIVTVNVDRVMIHDIFIPFVADKFEEMGFTKLWDPDKVVLIYDHLVPTSAVEDVRHFKIGDAFADKYGLTHVHRRDGICHQLSALERKRRRCYAQHDWIFGCCRRRGYCGRHLGRGCFPAQGAER